MSQILEVRLEDGSVAAIDESLTSGGSLNASVLAAGATIVDTGFSPPPGGAATVTLTWNGFDAVTPAVSGGIKAYILRRTPAGVLTVAGTGTPLAPTGDAALNADVTLVGGVSANNTLTIDFNIGAYAEPVTFVATLATGASQA